MEGLRERKKRRTRESIVAAAFRLFGQRGYDATTVADIADAADIAPRTFFGYFAAKEEVVFFETDALHAELEARLGNRPAGQSAFEALRAWSTERLQEGDPAHAELSRIRRGLVAEHPALRARDRAEAARFEALLAAAIARDLDTHPGALAPRMVAAAALAAVEAVEDEGQDRDPLDVLDEAVAFFEGGLAALRDRA